ncbi:GIY-YIG nuclease family protein [Psychrobacter sp. I-STPA6b]|uniref:GIY-YIG nuclease family protein n=1 Tax=Psychrobacter sp. I-STPA6b TaxID=2585718 RepID=UPI001D0C01CC|nr:GIY-YIG nuclease family protein [Psychrobacter sp. I-STPA6b]
MIKLDEIYQSREFKTLEDIFAQDDTGLLDDVKPIKKQTGNDSVLKQQFAEINDFIDEHGYVPKQQGDSLKEKMLARQLASINNNQAYVSELIALDSHGILSQSSTAMTESEIVAEIKTDDNLPTKIPNQNKLQSNTSDQGIKKSIEKDVKEAGYSTGAKIPSESLPNSLDDIFNQDDLGLFDDIKSDILINPDADTNSDRRSHYDQYDDEEIASRFECQDFAKFIPTFERIHHAIQAGSFSKANFSSIKNITVGSVFVLQGLLCYVADIYKSEVRKNERNQQRLRLIFANGTESNMLIRSLATAQYKYDNSYQVIITDPEWINNELAQDFGDKRLMTGVIYVAKLTNIPDELRQYQNLHKIGYSTLTSETRSKYSIKDPTFLQQAVDIIAEWQVYDANAQSVEGVLHAFFASQRVNLSVIGADNKKYQATEWFDVPLSEIEKAIELVITGEINKYRMDEFMGRIVLR